MAFSTIDGERDIKDNTITDRQVNANAGIKESKLALDYSTSDLYQKSVRIDEDREIQEGIYLTFPATGFKMKDAVNGKTYLFTLENGVLTAKEV